MGAFLTSITVCRLPPIPHLTPVGMNLDKMRDRASKVDVDHTRPGGNLGNVGPMLVTHIMNRAQKFWSVIDILVRRIIRKVVNYNINPIWRRGRDNSHPKLTDIQLTPKLDELTSKLGFKSHTSDLVSTLLDTQHLHILSSKMVNNSLSYITKLTLRSPDRVM